MDEERVQESQDASMMDASQFPAISDQRPRRRFLGVQVPTDAVDPGFHLGGRPQNLNRSHKARAVEVLGEEKADDGDYIYAFFDDNVVRRPSLGPDTQSAPSLSKLPATPFLATHRGVMDNYMERKAHGTSLPFDYSGGPPYVHPDSRMRSTLKIKITRQQPSTTSSSGGVSEIPSEGNDEDEDADGVESSESNESNSEGYEEDENVEGVRRSARTQKPKKQRSLHPSPRKTRSKAASLLTKKHRAPPATSGSDVEDDSSLSDSDSDVQITEAPLTSRPKRLPQNTAQQSTKVIFQATVPAKLRTPRIPRPMLQAYGVVVPIDDSEFNGEKDPLQCHRPECAVCRNSPAHAVVKVNKNKEFAKMGGWIRCMRCTEAVHWKCLSAVDQAEVLRAARLREKQEYTVEDNNSASAPPERQSINYDEMTDYICAACNQGGLCFECHRDLKTDNREAPVQDPKDDTVMVAKSSIATVENKSQGEKGPTELLFRCNSCQRAAHYAHLRSPWTVEHADEPGLIEEMASYYQFEYRWQCDDCSSYDAAVDKIIAWRPCPANTPILSPEEVATKRLKDPWPREYLVKWVGKSYRRTTWVPHLWLVSTTYQKLRNFILNGTKVRLEHLRSVGTEQENGATGRDEEEIARRRVYEEEGGPPLPNLRAEECIPEPWKRIEQVLDVVFWAPHKRIKMLKGKQTKARAKKSHVVHSSDSESQGDVDAEEMKKQEVLRERSRVTGTLFLNPDCTETPLSRKRRNGGKSMDMDDIDDVVWCYAKWGELEYQEGKKFIFSIHGRFTNPSASWDTPPKRGDPEWDDFEAAFSRYVQSQAVFVAKMSNDELKKRDNRDLKKFSGNKMEVSKSYVADKGLNLRPFQVEGVNWLSYHWWSRQSAILADEMGLGKTIQIITFLAKLVERKVWPHLILVPNSTILNWTREFQTWAPDVRAVPYYGDAASRDIIRKYEIFHSGATSGQTKLKLHVLITTYETFLTKHEWASVFKAPTRWETLVIDEGQRLKNNASLLFQRLNTIDVGHRVLMTGTPLNNNLRELFNLMNFIDRENWPDVEELERQYQQDLLTPSHVTALHEKLKNYFLRRTKEILNLPQKHEIIVPVSLSKLQKGIYKSLIESNLSLLNTLVSSGPTTKTSKTNLRNILMQSRKCVQHPYLVDNDLEPIAESNQEMHRQLIDASGKLRFLEIMLRKLKARGRRVLLFSQFVIALDIIEDFIVGEGYKFLRLDGDLKGSLRQKDIDRFNAPGSDYFIYLLSTRAGGVGINLATADTVIIFDPDFNPHQDAQAIARAHRFGQKKPVIVFRMMAVTGPEKKIMHAGKKKLLLDHVIVQSMEDEEPVEDLEAMLLSGAKGLFEGGEDGDILYTESSIDSMIENAIQEASKTKETVAEASGLTFEFAQIWESSNQADDGNEVEADTDFWARMIAQAQEEKEKMAAQEVAESGRGAKRRAKAAVTYQVAFEDSPQKPTKPKGTESDDVEYHEQDHGASSDAHTEATSEDEAMRIQLLSIVRGEVKELEESTLKVIEAKEKKNRIRREKRAQQKLLRKEEPRLAAQQAAKATAANQEMIDRITSSSTNGPGIDNQPGASGPSAARLPQPPPGSTYAPENLSVTQSSRDIAIPLVAARATVPIPQPQCTALPVPQKDVTDSREPSCSLCKTRHGVNACPVVQTLDDLKALRAKLLKSNDTSEDKMFALQCLDEDIAAREAEQARATLQQQPRPYAAYGDGGAPLSDKTDPTASNGIQPSSATFGPQKRPVNAPFSQNGSSFPSSTSHSQTYDRLNAVASSSSGVPNRENGLSSQPMVKKRPFDGPIPNDRPTKKANVGTMPAMCVLCNQPFHAVVDCKIMSADMARMKQRLEQLAANRNPEAQSAIQALMHQYNTKLKQAARPPTKYIEISD